jgi:hypothetical protein
MLPEHTPQVSFAQDDDVIETLSSDATEESFAHSVHPRGAGCDLKHFDASAFRNTIEVRPVLLVPVPNQCLGPDAVRSCFTQLLRRPLLGRLWWLPSSSATQATRR